MYQQVEGTGVDLGDPVPISQGPLSISIPRDPVVPSQKVRLDPPGTHPKHLRNEGTWILRASRVSNVAARNQMALKATVCGTSLEPFGSCFWCTLLNWIR